ncbi:MAG: FAD-binding protein [Candidatus Levybacteria bacterium]|nr:FAD-binding protein [Candidatus Levybacteria bacterium]
MNNALLTLERVLGANTIKQNEPMLSHTACKIGGPAEYYVEIDKTDDFVRTIIAARKARLPVFVFGGGSNLIVSDNGIKGLVIKNNCRRHEIVSMKGRIKNRRLDVAYALVYAEAGVIMNQLVRFTIDQGLSGLEYALGIPGSVGGVVYTNVDFPENNTSVGEYVHSVQVLTNSDEIQDRRRTHPSDIIVSAIFRLVPFDKKLLWERGTEAATDRNTALPEGNISYAFRNIGIADAMKIPTPGHSTSPTFLIRQSGLAGKRIGDALISDVNPNCIVNLGKAKASDVLSLMRLIKNAVFKKFGVTLEMDVKVVGEM